MSWNVREKWIYIDFDKQERWFNQLQNDNLADKKLIKYGHHRRRIAGQAQRPTCVSIFGPFLEGVYGQHVHKPMATGWEIWSSGCLRNGATSQLMVGRLGALMSIAHYSPVSSNVAGLGRWSASCWWLVCLNMFKSNPCHWNLRWWAGKCKVFIAPRKSCCFLLVV
jgi:hypothetical protein